MDASRHHEVFEQLEKAEPSTMCEVRAILEDIRCDKGYIDNDYRQDLENLTSANRYRTLRDNAKQRKREAAFAKSVSQQLYSSKYRFLYELVQNADDSTYSKARQASKLPFLRFRITPATFIVETNEDGFTRANVEAVCATGESSKKASAEDDHIGEKGFGFKSVFSIADDVHVQSGVWSFRFQHQRGDDGLGMVTPLHADAVILPRDVTTRITLHLTKAATEEYQGLIDAVTSLPETTIFFLQKLEQFQIYVTDQDGKVTKTRFEKTPIDISTSTVQLRHYRERKDKTVLDESLYRCFTHVIGDMPETEYRKGRKSARIDLAFPVESQSQKPKLSKYGQYVFAFLPLQRVQGIQFLIQSDFITSANRESVIDCPWNTSIFQGVAEAFGLAIESFTKGDDPLRCSWLEYLPTELSDDRWKELYPLILGELADRPILETWQGCFKEPHELLMLHDYMLHDGEPILDDLPDDEYLAPQYRTYEPRIMDLGAWHASLFCMIRRLEADIVKLTSRLKTTNPSDSWHVAFASMFSRAWAGKSPDVAVQTRLKRLGIIPLHSRQQWAGVSDRKQKIYLSDIDGVAIPSSIGLRLLDTYASSDATRRAFYMHLGVEECSPGRVLDEIMTLHEENSHPPDTSSHLRYLFYANENPKKVQQWIRVPTTVGKFVTASDNLYFPSAGEDDLHQLINGHHSRFQDTVVFIEESLMNLELGNKNGDGFEWQAWLQQATGSRRYPPLLQEDTNNSSVELSSALRMVYKYSARTFLRALRAHWTDYGEDAHQIEADLRVMQVRCLDDVDGKSQREALKNTYLPTASVINSTMELGLSPQDFQILCLPGRRETTDALDKAGYRSWRFLKDFGARCEPDLSFYQDALETVSKAVQKPDFDILVKIYKNIALLARASDHDELCEFFFNNVLWVPSSECWVFRGICNWRGPAFLRHYSLLDPHYGQDSELSRFFQNTLNVKDTNIDNVLRELKWRSEEEDPTSLTDAMEIYQFLWKNTSGDEQLEMVMEFFTNKRILGTKNEWYEAEKCVWQTPFLLSGYFDVSTMYPQLEAFFVGRLKIKKVTPSMLVGEITKMVKKKKPKYDKIRKRLIEVGMVLAKSELDIATKDALQSLSETKFLPMRYADGSSELLGISAKYVIADHPRYRSALSGDGTIDMLLDFSVEEVQIMNVMFEHLGIQKHYLSSLVSEKSDIEGDVEEDDGLSNELRDKAYALYCCAAKYKSVKALLGDEALYETLSRACILKGDLTTHLVIDSEDLDLHLRVPSDRAFLHYDLAEGYLKLYVPEGRRQRQACYRSQLPTLLADIMAVDQSARHDISIIIDSSLKVLEDILVELDISSVSWIEKPVFDLSDDETDSTSSLVSQDAPNATYTGTRRRSSLVLSDLAFVDYATASSRQTASNTRVSRSPDRADRDRHIGALGEAFVFEMLSDLGLKGFSLDNWRSTIRGELSRYPKYAGLKDWEGRETADIVYQDYYGELTEWLSEFCTGDFPIEQDCPEQPIEYYFEVKTTTDACGSRFFLSAGQYKRMHKMAIKADQEPTRVYVIVRVYNVLSKDNKGWEIYVDPVRLQGTFIEFEAERWVGRTL